MFLFAICLLFSLLEVISPFQFPPFNHHSKVGNILNFSDIQIRRSPLNNEVVECHMEDFLNIITLQDLQIMIEALASRTAVSPLLILSKLHRRMRSRDGVKEILIDNIDGSSLTEASPQTIIDFPSESKIPLEASRAPYSLSPHASIIETNKEDDIVIVPVVPSSMNMMKMGHILRKDSTLNANNVKPVIEEMSNVLPGVFLPSGKHNRLKPPLGATVRIDYGDSMTREISLTVSPLMTFIEALRQAETKYENDSEIITFGHSSTTDCYVVNSIADVFQNKQSAWKITVTDRDNQVVYDSFCLPNNNDVLVKPGSVISLTYVPI